MSSKKIIIFVLVLQAMVWLSGAAAAEKYPAREIQIITANPPGGFVDITVRLMAGSLGKNLGVPIIVVNRPGAGGAAGTVYLVKAKPDGYTIGCISSKDTIITPATIPNLPFKYSDLDPLCKYANDSTIVFCKGDSPWKTLEDLVADVRKRPGQYTYGATTHSVSHFLMESFLKSAGITMTHVPLSAAGQTTTRILGGNLDLGVSSLTPVAGQLRAGTLRGLFLAAAERSSTFPQIPTLKEKGYRDPVVTLYTGFFAPRGLASPIRQKIVNALEKTIQDPTLKKKLNEVGANLEYLPGVALTKEIEEDYVIISKLAKTMASPRN